LNFAKLKKKKLGDAIIAATALAYDLILLTRDTDDFKKNRWFGSN
jgi:predicted nucleic acid-binding protein